MRFSIGLILAAMTPGCGEDPDPAAIDDHAPAVSKWFVEVAEEYGVRFDVERAVSGDYFMPDSMAAGCALFDYDNDGDLDIYVVNAVRGQDGALESDAGANRLFRQDGPLRFTDVTREAGVGDRGYGMGVAVGDYDNDGEMDLYVTNYGRDTLYRNEGGGSFRDVTERAGISNHRWSASAGFFDYDGDGDLDIFVTNYLDYDPALRGSDAAGRPEYPSPSMFEGVPDVLYRNNGDGTFFDASEEAGIASRPGKGLGVLFIDLDGDERRDVYVANDGEANFAWINRGDGTFIEAAMEMGIAANVYGRYEAGMGVAAGDFDHDGDFDLFLTHLVSESNTLYRREAPGMFYDVSIETGLVPPSVDFTGFGTAFTDVELDGDLDLVVANGRVLRGPVHPDAAPGSHWRPYAEHNQLFLNAGDGRFAVAKTCGDLCSGVEVGRGLAAGDLDNDGDVDIVITNGNGTVRIYRNEMPREGRWLVVRALDPKHNRDAFGAVVEVRAGEHTWVRLVDPSSSYLSASDVRVHFGLGKSRTFDAVAVRWPDGTRQEFPGGATDQILTLKKGEDVGSNRNAPYPSAVAGSHPLRPGFCQ